MADPASIKDTSDLETIVGDLTNETVATRQKVNAVEEGLKNISETLGLPSSEVAFSFTPPGFREPLEVSKSTLNLVRNTLIAAGEARAATELFSESKDENRVLTDKLMMTAERYGLRAAFVESTTSNLGDSIFISMMLHHACDDYDSCANLPTNIITAAESGASEIFDKFVEIALPD